MNLDNLMRIFRPNGRAKVRNPRQVRILAALQAVAGLLLFFLLFWPDWLSKSVYWVLLMLSGAFALGEMAFDYRRRRSRRRWRDAGLLLLSLSLVWIVVMPLFILMETPDDKATAYALLGLGVASLFACIFCFWRWRRLRAEAELRRWRLNAERRKRASLRVRADKI